MPATVSRWGNSLAVRLPREVTELAGLVEGSSVAIDVAADGSVVLRPARPHYRLEDLLEGVKAEDRHEEVDWGGPAGREVW